MNKSIVDILYVSDKLVITPLLRTVWPIFSFLVFCCHLARLNAREISKQNMKNSGIIDHIVLETVVKIKQYSHTEGCLSSFESNA